ncbi:metal-dependent hydrolase [Arthrobacter sp. MYb23]|uniref:M48 metallopeptidase family protein n=1 Tax=unclassified Arthrobacter TaxID=235627 RepID=UPI000CFB012D|nr:MULTISPECIES: M48 family metallopeptidase [unclassified Arthrobacter]PRB44414.1 metal-dependent hydrolase [Arthrobacter sp. MYb51]PRB98665.1 metal-dependent hydrolase [Arthrobacter sp. MYb23]
MTRPSASNADFPHITDDGAPVVVRRSARRRRTVAAFWEDGNAVIAIPASFTKSQEREWVRRMLAKLQKQGERQAGAGRRRPATDQALAMHAEYLSRTYLGGRPVPTSVRWVSNQNSRWGSATPADGTIRLSNKLQRMPQWVIDYVLVHELAHLLVVRHNAEFWKLVEAYPETHRAKAFLEGVAFATSRGIPAEPDAEVSGDPAWNAADQDANPYGKQRLRE